MSDQNEQKEKLPTGGVGSRLHGVYAAREEAERHRRMASALLRLAEAVEIAQSLVPDDGRENPAYEAALWDVVLRLRP